MAAAAPMEGAAGAGAARGVEAGEDAGAAAPAGAAAAAGHGCWLTGELSQDEFETAAAEFARWWNRRAAPARFGGSGGAAERRQPEGRQELDVEAQAAAEAVTWYVSSCRQPVTGEAVTYLAAEVLLRPGRVPPFLPAGAAPGAAGCAGMEGGSGGASGGDGADAEEGAISLSEEEEEEADEATLVPGRVAAPAGASFAATHAPVLLASSSRAAEAAGEEEEEEAQGAQCRHVLDAHVAHHASYRVPLLLFRARRLGGGGGGGTTTLSHAQLLALLERPLARHADAGVPDWAYVTQVTHPALGQPWAALHPCQTAALLRLMLSGGGGGGGRARDAAEGSVPAAAAPAAGDDNDDDGPDEAREEGPCRGAAPLLRYMLAWFSAAGRAVGLRLPQPPPAPGPGM